MKVLIEYCDEDFYNRHRTFYPKATLDCSNHSSGLVIVSDISGVGHACPLLREVEDIEGVMNARHDKYSLTVSKSPVYDWSEIQGKVLEALAKILGIELTELDVEEDEIEKLLVRIP